MTTKTIIFIYGLPGSGKSTLAKKIQLSTNYPWYNADRIRNTLSSDLGFSIANRIEQARRMGSLAVLALDQPKTDTVIVDFVCPTPETYLTFKETVFNYSGEAKPRVVSIFMDTISKEDSRFADTAKLAEYKLISRSPDLVISHFLVTEDDWSTAVFKATNC